MPQDGTRYDKILRRSRTGVEALSRCSSPRPIHPRLGPWDRFRKRSRAPGRSRRSAQGRWSVKTTPTCSAAGGRGNAESRAASHKNPRLPATRHEILLGVGLDDAFLPMDRAPGHPLCEKQRRQGLQSRGRHQFLTGDVRITATLCRPHAYLLLEAALGCGCAPGDAAMGFIADMLESTLWPPYALLAGDAALLHCVCCAYLEPDVAILDAIAGALTLRAQHGVARRLN